VLLSTGCVGTPLTNEPSVEEDPWADPFYIPEYQLTIYDIWGGSLEFDEDFLNERTELLGRIGLDSGSFDNVWVPVGDSVRTKGNYGAISLDWSHIHSSSKYTIWHYAVLDDYDALIRITYLRRDTAEYANENGIVLFLQMYHPTIPNFHYPDPDYDRIEEVEITVNHTKTPALINVLNNGTRAFIYFLYNDMLVSVSTDTAILDNDGLAGLSFERYEGGEDIQ